MRMTGQNGALKAGRVPIALPCHGHGSNGSGTTRAQPAQGGESSMSRRASDIDRDREPLRSALRTRPRRRPRLREPTLAGKMNGFNGAASAAVDGSDNVWVTDFGQASKTNPGRTGSTNMIPFPP